MIYLFAFAVAALVAAFLVVLFLAEQYYTLDRWVDEAIPVWERGGIAHEPEWMQTAFHRINWTHKRAPWLCRLAKEFYYSLYPSRRIEDEQ